MFCFAVSIGSRLNAWNTKPTWRRRNRVSSLSDSDVSMRSPTCTSPEVAWSRPARQCISVDLPEPDGPMIAVNFAVSIVRSTPASACTWASPVPYVLVSPAARAAIAGIVVGGSRTVMPAPVVSHLVSSPR